VRFLFFPFFFWKSSVAVRFKKETELFETKKGRELRPFSFYL
jgi:hypothetical protein